jgi:hypothetical protein
MDKQTVRQLRQLMQTPQWGALEFAFNQYLKENFLDSSMKKENEFDTLWYVAYNEGGKYHLKTFFNNLDNETMNLE